MNKETEYLNLFNKNIVFDNKIYKVIKISSIYVYGLQYIQNKELILCDDVLFIVWVISIYIILLKMNYKINQLN